jgi:membrane protease YdiL (CAAX protease family)
MKRSLQFIILVCLVSWTIAGMAIGLGLREATGLGYTIFGAALMLIPAACTLVLQKTHKEPIIKPLQISFKLNGWFLVAGITPFLITFLALAINLLFPDVHFSSNYESFLSLLPAEQAVIVQERLTQLHPAIFLLIQVVSALFAGYTINAVFALGEELGWRGYLLKSLKGKKFITVSLLIGAVWGIWHFPLILIGHNYPQHPVFGVFMMIIFCILLTPTMIYIVQKSKSVITAAIFHGTMNAIASLPLLYVVGGNDLTNGVTGLAGFITLALVTTGFYLYDRFVTKENIFAAIVN